MKWYEWGPVAWAREYLNTHPRVENFFQVTTFPLEAAAKKLMFGCQTCGQCLLHENGMTCPMRCPKTLRNGPCGGVRLNGHCEVYPERWCVWYRAYHRSQTMPLLPKAWREDMFRHHPVVDWRLVGTASLLNELTGRAHGIWPKEPGAEKKATPAPAAKK
jgi:hypothetical protein